MAITRRPDGTEARYGGRLPATRPGPAGYGGGGAALAPPRTAGAFRQPAAFGAAAPTGGAAMRSYGAAPMAAPPQAAPANPFANGTRWGLQPIEQIQGRNPLGTPHATRDLNVRTSFGAGPQPVDGALQLGGPGAGAGGYGGGLGGVGGGSAADVLAGLRRDQDEANAANEFYFNQKLDTNAQGERRQLDALAGGYQGVYDQLAGNRSGQMDFLNGVYGEQKAQLGKLGGTAHAREDRRAAAARGGADQGLASRGLFNSTVTDSVRRGIDADSAMIHNAIDEDNARLGLGVTGQYGQQGLDVMGRNDAAAAAARLGYANAVPDVIGRSTAQRVGILEGRHDEGPDIDRAIALLTQPGALQPVYGGGGGYGGRSSTVGSSRLVRPGEGDGSGGSGDDLMDLLRGYLGGGGGSGGGVGYGGGGGDPSMYSNGFTGTATVDARTREANARVRAKEAEKRRQRQLQGAVLPASDLSGYV